MTMDIPAIVTHPCTLFRDGLHQILACTRFKPLHVSGELDEAAISQLSSAETSLFLLGLERCDERTFGVIRRVCAAASGLKAVVLAQSQTTEDVSSALEAGASGFLTQDISCERLIKSLELIVLGEVVVPATYLHAVGACVSKPAQLESQHRDRIPAGPAGAGQASIGKEHLIDGELVKGLSKRETSILRLLTQGASNKIIARQLVITEATVKAHLKAILRKLRLHNRTQAAMWASNHLEANPEKSNIAGVWLMPAIDQMKRTDTGPEKLVSNGN